MAKFTSPSATTAYYMHMGIVKQMAQGSTAPDTDVEVTLIISKTQMIYETKVLSVYKDEQDAFTVLHATKQIVRTSGSKIPYSDNAISQVSDYQLKLLSECELLSCKATEKQGQNLKELILYPNESLRAKAQVKTIRFSYEPATESIKEIETHYLKGQPMVYEKVSIYNTDFVYKQALPIHVSSKIYDSQGKLRDQYKGYKVIDQRWSVKSEIRDLKSEIWNQRSEIRKYKRDK